MLIICLRFTPRTPGSGWPRGGEVREASRGEAIARAAETPHIILNAPLVGQRLGYPDLRGLDLLELFAFVHPARFVVPTAAGLAARSGSTRRRAMPSRPRRFGGYAERLAGRAGRPRLARARRSVDLERDAAPARLGLGAAGRGAARSARARRADALLAAASSGTKPASGRRRERSASIRSKRGPRSRGLTGARRGARGPAGHGRRSRAGVRAAKKRRARRTCCWPRPGPGSARPSAYLAPASLWAEQARRHGLGLDLHQGAAAPARRAKGRRLFADADERRAQVVVRKGRENYLCLLNLEDALQGGFARPRGGAGAARRRAGRPIRKDGDMIGGDLPGWLAEPVPPRRRDRADRPARRMRLCRLPALPPLLHRARRARRAARPTS